MTVTTGARGLSRFRFVGFVEQAFLDVGLRHAAHAVAHFLGDQLRGIGVDRVVDLQHLALLHQQADDVDRALRHAIGEIRIVIASGMVTSRTSFSFGSFEA